MAGTLTISTLSDGTNSTSSTNCIKGSAKAWVNWQNNGTNSNSYNVSSITVNGTGDWTVNFTNAVSSTTTYAPIVGQGQNSTNNSTSDYAWNLATTSVGVRHYEGTVLTAVGSGGMFLAVFA